MHAPRRLHDLAQVARYVAVAAMLVTAVSNAHAEWLAPLTVETATTIPSGEIDFALGASYFRNRRYPPFTPSGFIQSQNLTAVPELALRAAVGSVVEVQASYEFLDLDEQTTE